jgi:hypothetical protein
MVVERANFECKLDGGIGCGPDGKWIVSCQFSEITTQEQAQRISEWLEQLVNAALDEIVFGVEEARMNGHR